eukprot:3842389-Rhodomonas_salina.1
MDSEQIPGYKLINLRSQWKHCSNVQDFLLFDPGGSRNSLRFCTSWCRGRRKIVPIVIVIRRVRQSSGGRSSGVGRSSGLNLEKVFQLAMKICNVLRDVWQKFRLPPEVSIFCQLEHRPELLPSSAFVQVLPKETRAYPGTR